MVLQKLRDRLTGVMAVFILGLLAVPFALVGVNSYFAPDTENNIAIVNDVPITLSEYNASFQNYRDRMRQILGESYNPEQFDGAIVRRQHLDTMIERELLRQVSAETGLSVDDQSLAQAIREVPGFQVAGEFDVEVYQRQLQAQALTPQEFEDQMRSSMVLRQYPATISASAIATSSEVDRYISIMEQQRAFAALVIEADVSGEEEDEGEAEEESESPPGEAQDESDAEGQTESEADSDPSEVSDPVGEDRVQAWYESHIDEYRHPERVVVEYLEVDAEALEADVSIDDEALRQRFEDQKARFIAPEARLASHILIEVSPTADDAEVETARQRAQALYERIQAGEDFAELARENSEDQGSAALGGDLDWVEPGDLAEAFENALYSLSLESPVSEPVQTGFGWHIIQLRDIRESEGMDFEEARPTLEAEMLSESKERQYLEIADRLVDIIYEDPTTLEAAADELSLEIKVAGPFDRSGGDESITANPEFVEAAFSDLVLIQGSASDPVNLGTNHTAIVRVREHLPEAPRELEEVRDEVIAAIRLDDAMKAAEARATAFLERLQGGEAIEAIAEETGVDLVQSDAARRTSPELRPDLRQALFELPAPQDDEPVRDIAELNDGYAVVELREVRPGSLSEEEEPRRESYRRRLANVASSIESQAFLHLLRERSEVQVFEDRL